MTAIDILEDLLALNLTSQEDSSTPVNRLVSMSPFKVGVPYDSSGYESKLIQPLQIPVVQLQPIRASPQAQMLQPQSSMYDPAGQQPSAPQQSFTQSISGAQQQQIPQSRKNIGQVPNIGGVKNMNLTLPVSQQGMYHFMNSDVQQVPYRAQGEMVSASQQAASETLQQNRGIAQNMRAGISQQMQYRPMVQTGYTTPPGQSVSPHQKRGIFLPPSHSSSVNSREFSTSQLSSGYLSPSQGSSTPPTVSSEPTTPSLGSGSKDDKNSDTDRGFESQFGNNQFRRPDTVSEFPIPGGSHLSGPLGKKFQPSSPGELVMSSEEFPTLTSSVKDGKKKDLAFGSISQGGNHSEGIGSKTRVQGRQSQSTDTKDSEELATGKITNTKYGMLGLLDVIQMKNPDLNMMALGMDLTSLGLNLNSPDNLHPNLTTPWPKRNDSDPKFNVPPYYKIPHPLPQAASRIGNFTDETLFYIFEYYNKDGLDRYAAEELMKRNWRYNKRLGTWMRLAPGNTVVLFNTNTWETAKMDVRDVPASS